MIVWAAILIGLSLGLLGSGGSIVTVPVLLYVLHMPEKYAITAALGVVGGISLFGLWLKRKGLDSTTVLAFALPGILGSFLGAGMGSWVSANLQLGLFILLMLLAAWRMWQPRLDLAQPLPARMFFVIGTGVGFVTGLVGVGGGFLILPALVLVARLSMHQAVATSLAIIALQSISAFIVYLFAYRNSTYIWPWQDLLWVLAIGCAGMLVGHHLGRHLPQRLLQRLFSIALLGLAVTMGYRTFIG